MSIVMSDDSVKRCQVALEGLLLMVKILNFRFFVNFASCLLRANLSRRNNRSRVGP